MTATGVTAYLFHVGEYVLSLISLVVFGKLIIFHFIMEFFDRKSSLKNYRNMERIKT
jgi:quinol-cytochrome oxidoreductase complex cytochrome b subunit